MRRLVPLALVLLSSCADPAPEPAPPTAVPLTIEFRGPGDGVVGLGDAAASCDGPCARTIATGRTVTLVAVARPGSTFVGWRGGGCAGTGPCVTTVLDAATITAAFVGDDGINVTRAGTGTGTVTDSLGGIDCGWDCDEGYAPGTPVTLTAYPDPGMIFTGWSGGGCAGAEPCTLEVSGAHDVTAWFEQPGGGLALLTVVRTGSASGVVTADLGGIDCGGDCEELYPAGLAVTLTATPDPGALFTGWSGGGCAGTAPCTVWLNQGEVVTAQFDSDAPTLAVARDGAGLGRVVDDLGGIDCGDDCDETYWPGAVVVLTATAEPGSVFVGWSGEGCSGVDPCAVSVTASHAVLATFALEPYTLTVERSGPGIVGSFPAGIDCGLICSAPFEQNSLVVLFATEHPDSRFVGWSGGGCTGTADCWVAMDQATTVTATFVPRHALTVTKSGPGAGTVTSAPAGIACGADCSELYDQGTTVTLTAVQTLGSQFMGWSGGGCTGTGPCTVTMSAAQSVNALFLQSIHALSVTRAGTGAATSVVTSNLNNPGINCGTTCSQYYYWGTTVTLYATPGPNVTFTGWSGACTGTGACVVTLDGGLGQGKAVTANFRAHVPLTVIRNGDGVGTVTSNPFGITCGGDCTELYDPGTVVTLTASPATGNTFGGWSGACTGTATTCNVTISAAATVYATFRVNKYWLTVNRAGVGLGEVISNPGSIDCPGSCSQKFDHGTTVTLTAFAYAGSTFTGWSGGGCSGTGTCSVLMTAARTVTANFTRPILTVTKFGNGTGTVTSSPAGISCGGDCTEAVNAGTTVTLTATPAAGTQFMGWVGGGCSGMGTCTTTITASTTVRANFYLTIHQVTVTKTGGGTGWVATSPLSGIACGTDCSEYYYYGTSVTLYATPDPGSTFTGWTGACTGLGPCTFSIVGAPGQAYPVTANFAPSS